MLLHSEHLSSVSKPKCFKYKFWNMDTVEQVNNRNIRRPFFGKNPQGFAFLHCIFPTAWLL